MAVTNTPVGSRVPEGGESPVVEEDQALVLKGSLKDRLAARRLELQGERSMTLPVPGYSEILAVRYRAIPYEVLRKIAKRHERISDTAEGEVALASDTLIAGCVDLLERSEDGEYRTLGSTWSPQTARDLFGVELPDEATSRQALQAIMPPDGGIALLLHYRRYDAWLGGVEPEIDEEIAKGW